jgi:hypothetical protein
MEYNFVELQTYRGINKSLYSGSVNEAAVDTKLTPTDVMPFKEASFFLNVSAFAGTNVIVTVVSQDPVSLEWLTIVTFTTKTGTGSEKKDIAANLGSKIAVVVTPTGAGVKTLTVSANFKIM